MRAEKQERGGFPKALAFSRDRQKEINYNKGRRNNCREGGGPGRIPAGAPMPNLAKGLLSVDSSSSHGAFPQDITNEWVKCSGQGRKT